MKTWKQRALVVLVLATIAGWLVFGHRIAAPGLEEDLNRALGLDTEVGFVLFGPDLNLYAYDVRFRAPGVEARVPWAKFVIPISKLWGSGSTRAIRFRHLKAVIDEEADLSFLTAGTGRGEGAADDDAESGEPLQEIVGEHLDIRVRDTTTGAEAPLLVTKRIAAVREPKGDYRLELDSGVVGEFPFDDIAMRMVASHEHLLITDFKLHAFDGIVGGLLDLHLKNAGSYNGEIEWHLLDVNQICRYYGVPHAEKRHGRIEGEFRFHASGPMLNQIDGSGAIRLERARFWSPVTFKVFGVLGVPAREQSWLSGAELKLTMEDGLVYLERGSIRGADYELDLIGLAELDGDCDMEVSYVGTTLAIRGNLADPEVKVLPLDAVTLPFDRLFRKRLKKR